MAKLTPKQKRFVAEYLVDLNATQAAGRAGYKDPNIGRQLITKNNVAEAIRKAMADREERTGVTQDWVVQELYKIAHADRGGIAKVVGGVRVVLTDTDDLDAEQRAALVGVEETKFGIKVTTCDKLKALELLGRHLGMFTDKVEQTGETTLRLELGAGLEEMAK